MITGWQTRPVCRKTDLRNVYDVQPNLAALSQSRPETQRMSLTNITRWHNKMGHEKNPTEAT